MSAVLLAGAWTLSLAAAAALGAILARRRRRAGANPPAVAASAPMADSDAAAAERRRIFADLHDDVGAKLLTLVHRLPRAEDADLVRSIFQDLRDIVSRSQQDPCTLLECLAQIREETEQRLLVMGSELIWIQPDDLSDPLLDEARTLHLFRIIRETVTNALRHGRAKLLRIRIVEVERTLHIDVTDDGPGMESTVSDAPAGRGTSGMRDRAAALQGSVEWRAGTGGGTKVVLRFPLNV